MSIKLTTTEQARLCFQKKNCLLPAINPKYGIKMAQ